MVCVAQVVPGVQDTNLSRDYASRTSATSLTINGANSYTKDIRLDGMNLIDEGGCGTITVNLNMDAVAEVQVISNGYTAENGRSTGGVISLVTKSGTNQYKGSLTTAAAIGSTRTTSSASSTTPRNRSMPSTSRVRFGGPVIIPGLCDSHRDHEEVVGFFASQEFADNQRPSVTTRANLPTDLERNGDFSQTFITTGTGAAAAYSVGPIIDPLTGK
jgi:hypothetical protein